jgi:hypothetical protein
MRYLGDSFAWLVECEPLVGTNQYFSEDRLTARMMPEKCPPIRILHLKRFEFNFMKHQHEQIDSPFEVPPRSLWPSPCSVRCHHAHGQRAV